MTAQAKYATSTQWAGLDPVLGRGEFAYSTDTGEVVVGDGVSRWSALDPMGGGGGGSSSRATSSCSVSGLAAGAGVDVSAALAPQFTLLRVACGAAGLRVRVYASAAHRTLDASRPVGTDPVGDHGLVLEFVSAPGATSAWLSPVPVGYLTDTVSADVPIRVTNVGGSVVSASVTFTWSGLEAVA